ncbi:hypothetical protein CAC42_6633 [Sphaceloma murrayae]|uniref:Fork-head domain-containing protein n=1 Tax=Sphaceloma murrayae TaxID=2082308 RepID=A0A2K1QGW2_9PEZI|nr:hypothetical protein CAC42_6633 [Sphaceloma murrayae]
MVPETPEGSNSSLQGTRQVQPSSSEAQARATGKKPPCTQAQLIGMALLEAPQHQLMAKDIIHWIATNIPGYSTHDQKQWSPSINSALNEGQKHKVQKFIKGEKNRNDPHKSHFWCLAPGMAQVFQPWDHINQRMTGPEAATLAFSTKRRLGLDNIPDEGMGSPAPKKMRIRHLKVGPQPEPDEPDVHEPLPSDNIVAPQDEIVQAVDGPQATLRDLSPASDKSVEPEELYGEKLLMELAKASPNAQSKESAAAIHPSREQTTVRLNPEAQTTAIIPGKPPKVFSDNARSRPGISAATAPSSTISAGTTTTGVADRLDEGAVRTAFAVGALRPLMVSEDIPSILSAIDSQSCKLSIVTVKTMVEVVPDVQSLGSAGEHGTRSLPPTEASSNKLRNRMDSDDIHQISVASTVTPFERVSCASTGTQTELSNPLHELGNASKGPSPLPINHLEYAPEGPANAIPNHIVDAIRGRTQNFTAKKLADSYPLPKASVPLSVINSRPTRKLRMRMPNGEHMSRLGQNAAVERYRAILNLGASEAADSNEGETEQQNNYGVAEIDFDSAEPERFDSLQEAFEMPKSLVPMIYEGQLAFTEGGRQKNARGRTGRAKNIYRIGANVLHR